MPADGLTIPDSPPRCCSVGLLALAAVYLAAWLPVVGKGTDNPHLLAARINDEPPIVQQMLGMAQPSYGDPANYLRDPSRLPPEWGEIVFPGYIYYGGAYPGLGFLLYLPCRIAGAADFPAAPIALRIVSVLAGLAALVLAYRLGARLGGEIGGFLAGLLLITDRIFISYCTIIHPDSTMLAFGLAALTAGIAHAEKGGIRSLAVLGLFDGFVHGAKMGGPWTVAFSIAAAWWGWQHDFPPGSTQRWIRGFARAAFLGIMAATGFVVTTPYVLLNDYYREMIRNNYAFFRTSPWAQATIADWIHVFAEHLGTVLMPAMLASIAAAMVLAFREQKVRKPVVLTFIFAVSVVAWYAAFVRLWATAHYLLPAFAALYVLAGAMVGRGISAIANSQVAFRSIGSAGAIAVVLGILWIRGDAVLSVIADRHAAEEATPIAINAWATEHLPHDAKIIADDVAYFDRRIFPNARLHGGLLNYRTLESQKPDYFVISSSIYSADHYVGLRKTQNLPRDSKEEFSVRLYQDLLDMDGTPGAELVHVLHPSPVPKDRLERLKVCVASLLGQEPIRGGPELRIYRYRASGSDAESKEARSTKER
jgi:hypothetical protein